jgi:hypothetical protein
MMTSAGARESMHVSKTAAGYCPFALAFCSKVVAVFPLARTKTLVALLHCLDDLVRCQFVAQLLRQGVCACLIGQEEAATREAGHSAGRQLKKIPATHTIAVKGMSKLRAHVRSSLRSNDWNDIIVGYFRLLEGIKERRKVYFEDRNVRKAHFRPSRRPLPAI